MRAAMALLAVLATIGGVLQLPFGLVDALDKFLEPSFADSRYYASLKPSDSFTLLGLAIGAVLGVLGIAIAYRVWVQRPGTAGGVRQRFRGAYRLFFNKWYFDELIDALVVRPFAAFGRFGQSTFERVFVDGTLVGGPTGIVRAGSAAVRAVQSGFLRVYAALMLCGLAAVGLYFLIQAS
jgi:NADH-quinone oxidoreductase subunit L